MLKNVIKVQLHRLKVEYLKPLIGDMLKSTQTKSLNFSDNTVQADGLCKCFKNYEEILLQMKWKTLE